MNLNLDDLFPETPLHTAALMGDLEAMKQLLADGADINERDSMMGETPLHQAISHNAEIMHELKRGLSKARDAEEDAPKSPQEMLANLPKLGFPNLARQLWQTPRPIPPPKPDNWEVVRFLLENGADVNATDKHGTTPLMDAASAGQSETVRLLLDWGADTHPQNEKGDNALMQAAESQRLEVVRLLLERGADAEQRTPQGGTLLMAAARGGSVEIVRLLVECGAAVNVTTDTGNSALLTSILWNRDGVRDYLRSVGASVGILEWVGMGELEQADALPLPEDRSPAWGFNVMDWAVRYEKHETLRFLLNKGIRFDPNDERGQKIMQRAMMLGDQESIRLLQEAGLPLNQTSPLSEAKRFQTVPLSNLTMAVSRGDVQLARMLIEQGANVNEGGGEAGLSPLFSAVTQGSIEMINLLLDAGANVNGTAENTMSPLAMAVMMNKEEVVKLLLERGANPKDKTTRAPLMSMAQRSPLLPLLQDAIKGDYFELATAGKTDELLAHLDAGTDISAADEFDRTALHLAARGGHLETVCALLDRGANVNQSGLMDMTPLMDAVVGGHLDVVNLLLERGADVNHITAQDNKPLMMALHGKKPDIARRLIDAGAKVGMVESAALGDLDAVRFFLREGKSLEETSGDMTPLMAASNGGHREIVEFLLGQGADINAASHAGATALVYAVTGNHPDMVNLLLDRGADVNACHKNGRHIERQTTRRKPQDDPEVDAQVQVEREKIWARMRAPVPLEMAVYKKDADMVNLLLDRGANPDGTQELFDASPLQAAIGVGRADLVRLLLERGADPNRRHPEADSLLHWAKFSNASPEIMDLLHAATQAKSDGH